MADNLMYGILFVASNINEKNMLLNPYYIVDGMLTSDGYFMDKYDRTYINIDDDASFSNYDRLYGFAVKHSDLVEYFKENEYPKSQTDFPELCANIYLAFAKRYAFILEKHDNDKPVCYAVNLYTKESTLVDVNKNIMQQLMGNLTGKDSIPLTTNEEPIEKPNNNLYDQKAILERVKERVIGQDEAAFSLVSTICKNLKYANFKGMKSNILLYGPTGCGKTELIRSASSEFDLPFIVETMNHYTASGYVGDSVKKIIRNLYVASGRNIEKTQKGIVYLDEFDKLASPSSNKTVNKTDVQEELLTMLEGAKIEVGDSKTGEKIMIDTSNITFILGGSFDRLQTTKKKAIIGFNSEIEEEVVELSNDEFKKYGIISEVLGRTPVKIPIRQLSVDDLCDVLTKSKISCLRIYEEALLKGDNVKIVYRNKENFILKVAQEASVLKVGARGLKTVVDKIFLPALGELGNDITTRRELIVSSETVKAPNNFVLKKVRGDRRELSKRTGESNS